MLRHVVTLSLFASVALLVAAPGLAQTDGDTKIKPYTGEAIFLDDVPSAVPAARVNNSVKTQNYDNGKVWIERGLTKYSDNSFVSDGVYREFYRDGQQFVEGQYREGEPVGEWTYWHPNGTECKKVAYKAGQPDGTVEYHSLEGVLEARRNFAVGKRAGKWESFDPTGEQLLVEQHYQDSQPVGVWKWWYKNGQLQREAPFEGGKMHGLVKEWKDDGTPRAEANFQEGKRHGLSTQWMLDGRKVEQNYEEGKPVTE